MHDARDIVKVREVIDAYRQIHFPGDDDLLTDAEVCAIIDHATEIARDCDWQEGSFDVALHELTPADIVRNMGRHYDGGMAAMVHDALADSGDSLTLAASTVEALQNVADAYHGVIPPYDVAPDDEVPPVDDVPAIDGYRSRGSEPVAHPAGTRLYMGDGVYVTAAEYANVVTMTNMMREHAARMHDAAVALWNLADAAAGTDEDSPYRADIESMQRTLASIAWPETR